QLDIQPPQGQPSNYFTLDIVTQYDTLDEYVSARNFTKADFTIDGKEIYTNDKPSLSDSEMLYFAFSHDSAVYDIHLWKSSYNMSEVQAIFDSLDLN
ncbi:MAG: hypothetical protein AAB776_00460, partial [Patescibacteria group bacterium]